LRQLLIHRHKLVEMRTRVKTGLQHLALNRGVQKRSRLWSVRGRAGLEQLPLQGWAARRRTDLLHLLDTLDRQVGELDEVVEAAAEHDPQARLLMTQPGVRPLTALAFVLTIGDVSRFASSSRVASYLDLIPHEHSSGGKQRLGATSKQVNRFLRMLLVEAVRKLAVRLYWMLQRNAAYPEIAHIESSSQGALAGGKPAAGLIERSRIPR
jgi:transposase